MPAAAEPDIIGNLETLYAEAFVNSISNNKGVILLKKSAFWFFLLHIIIAIVSDK